MSADDFAKLLVGNDKCNPFADNVATCIDLDAFGVSRKIAMDAAVLNRRT